MIEKINSKSRNSEFDTLNTMIAKVYNESNVKEDTYLPSIFNTLKPISERFAAAVDRQREESNLSESDDNRDAIGKNAFYLVTGYSHHPVKEINEAAQKVMNVLNNYGLEIFSMSYAIESSKINSMLLQLEAPEVKEAITKLSGVAEVVAELKKAQEEFEAIFIHSQKNKSESFNSDNATDLRKEIVDILNNQLIPYLNGMMAVDAAKYGSFVHELASHITLNNSKVKTRARRQKTEVVAE